MKRGLAILLILSFLPISVRAAPQTPSPPPPLNAWQLGLYPIGETLGKQLETLITIAQFGSAYENYRIDGREWVNRPDYRPFLLYLSLRMRPSVRVLNFVQEPTLISAPEEKFTDDERLSIQSEMSLQGKVDVLRRTTSYPDLRSWEKRGVELSLQADMDFVQFSNEGLLLMKVADTPCEDVCRETMQEVQSKLPKGNVYRVDASEGRVRVWLRLPKTDSDVGGFSRPLEYTPPGFPKIADAIYSKISDLFYKWPMGETLASAGKWVGERTDAYLSDEEYRSVMTLLVAPTGRALQGVLAKWSRNRTISKLLRNRGEAKAWIEVREEVDGIKAAHLRLRAKLDTMRGNSRFTNFIRRAWPLTREPGVSRQASRVYKTFKAGKFVKVTNLSGRTLSIVGKSLFVFVVVADAAAALIAAGEPRDVVIQKVARIFSDAGLGAGALYLSAAVPVAGLVAMGVAVACELGHSYVHPDIPTAEDLVEASTVLLSDGYKLASNIFWQEIRDRNLVVEDWEKERNKPLRYRVPDSDRIVETSMRVVDFSDVDSDAEDAEGSAVRYRKKRRVYHVDPTDFLRAIQDVEKVDSKKEIILQTYAKRYLETVLSALMFVGQVGPNRALTSAVELGPIQGLAWVAPLFAANELGYQYAKRDVVIRNLSAEIGKFLNSVKSVSETPVARVPSPLNDPRITLCDALEDLKQAWENCSDYDASGVLVKKESCFMTPEERSALTGMDELRHALEQDIRARPNITPTS